ncbi:MAG: hypothetical protein V4489_01630, partial [Chlamydiota bacterium]
RYQTNDLLLTTKKLIIEYQQNEKRILDLQAAFDYQRLAGIAEGEAKKAREMALCLLENGIPISLAVTASGLSEEEIRSLL